MDRQRPPAYRIVTLAVLPILSLSPLAAQPEELREERVKPGINERWTGDDIDGMTATLERDGREVFEQKELLAAVAGPRPGSVVADVGAGSGFMVLELARLVGDTGKVIAVDINPKMQQQVASRAKQAGLSQVTTVVSTETSVELPPDSVDMVFMSDTYHHFELPKTMLASIHRALRPGGQMVIVDFERIPGVSSDWIIGHVRAGSREVIEEVEAAGFAFINRHELPSLEENYVLRFQKPN